MTVGASKVHIFGCKSGMKVIVRTRDLNFCHNCACENVTDFRHWARTKEKIVFADSTQFGSLCVSRECSISECLSLDAPSESGAAEEISSLYTPQSIIKDASECLSFFPPHSSQDVRE